MFYWLTQWFRDIQLGARRRSSGWSRVRKEFYNKNSECEVCGTKKKIEIHHYRDFSTYPELELDLNNLRSLCRYCHLLFGHKMNYRDINLELDSDIKFWDNRLNKKP